MIPGLFRRDNGKSTYKKDDHAEDPFRGKSIEDKIIEIISARQHESYLEDIRRARVYYRTVLAYRGYFNLGPWDEGSCTYSYDVDDWTDYGENRFRRNVLINTGLLIRMEPTPIIRPGSAKPADLEAALANEAALEIIHEHIGYDQLKADKALFKALFGNVFVYSDYQIDRRYGTLLVPKFKYEPTELPGAAYCPECGNSEEQQQAPDPAAPPQMCPDCGLPMQQIPPMPTEVQKPDGFDERTKGQEFSQAFSPLEVKVRSKVVGGIPNAPFLLRMFKEDADAVRYVYKDLDVKPRGTSSYSGGDSDASLRYQDNLAALPPNIFGAQSPYWATTNYFDQVQVCQAWIRPQLYRGDKELEKEAPDGLLGVMVESELAEWRPESMDDHWTHELYIRNPGSFYGDGMVDSIPSNRMINRIDQLQIQHLEYDTVPLRLKDADMIVETDISNDPAKKWIDVNVGPDKKLSDAVFNLNAQTLSNDVNILKSNLYQTDREISGASDIPVGGANTPYSTQALASEQGQIRFTPTIYYNALAIQQHTRQVLKIAERNWIDTRNKTDIDRTTGKPKSVSLTGADLSRGEISIKVLTNDFKPKTSGERMQALEYMKGFGIDPTASPRQRLEFFETIGFTPEGDMLSTQTRRAYRQIEKITAGQPIAPNPFIDDGNVQAPVIQEYLASKEGDQLQEQNPQAWQAIIEYMKAVMQMAAMKQNAMMGMGLAPGGPPPNGQPGGPPGAKPSGPPGGQPGQPGGASSPELAQAPVPESQKKIGAPLPAGARQT